VRGKKMEKQIICPNCHRTISSNPIIKEATKGAGFVNLSLICECGERITNWLVTALLREQKFSWK